jgi:hypothetical protein
MRSCRRAPRFLLSYMLVFSLSSCGSVVLCWLLYMMLVSSRHCSCCRRSRVIWWISPCWARVVNIEKTPAGRAMSIPRFSVSHFNKVSSRLLWTFIMAYHASHRDRVDEARQPRRSIYKHRLTSRRTQTVLQCLLLLFALVVYKSLFLCCFASCSYSSFFTFFVKKFCLWFLL